jgi:excisionase family DNA binding protein
MSTTVLERKDNCKSVASEQLLTQEQLAEYLNVTLSTVETWLRENRLPVYRLGWKLVRIRVCDVEKFLSDSLIPARADRIPVPRHLSKAAKERRATRAKASAETTA